MAGGSTVTHLGHGCQSKHTCARVGTGVYKCWGDNNHGQGGGWPVNGYEYTSWSGSPVPLYNVFTPVTVPGL